MGSTAGPTLRSGRDDKFKLVTVVGICWRRTGPRGSLVVLNQSTPFPLVSYCSVCPVFVKFDKIRCFSPFGKSVASGKGVLFYREGGSGVWSRTECGFRGVDEVEFAGVKGRGGGRAGGRGGGGRRVWRRAGRGIGNVRPILVWDKIVAGLDTGGGSRLLLAKPRGNIEIRFGGRRSGLLLR